eukprot:5251448-Pyramimonas_sp.AAC.1
MGVQTCCSVWSMKPELARAKSHAAAGMEKETPAGASAVEVEGSGETLSEACSGVGVSLGGVLKSFPEFDAEGPSATVEFTAGAHL